MRNLGKLTQHYQHFYRSHTVTLLYCDVTKRIVPSLLWLNWCLILSRFRFQMVIPTKTVSCKRCLGYTHSWSSWILWYWFHKVTQVFMSVESKNSTENHFLSTLQTICISWNRCCMEKISSPVNWGNQEIWSCFGICYIQCSFCHWCQNKQSYQF